MNEAFISGVVLFLFSAAVVAFGYTSGEMPFEYRALDTRRKTNPAAFWGLLGSFGVFGLLGIMIAVRHWTG